MPTLPKFHQLRSLAIRLGVSIIHSLEPGQFFLFVLEFFSGPFPDLNRSAQQESFVTVEAQSVGTKVDPVEMMVAEGVKFLVAAVLAVNNQRLVIWHIITLAEIFKDCR